MKLICEVVIVFVYFKWYKVGFVKNFWNLFWFMIYKLFVTIKI